MITCTTLCVSEMCLWKSIGGVSSTNQYVTTSLRRKARYESWQRLVVVHTLVIVCFNDTFNIAIGTSLFKTLLPRTSSSTEDIVTNPAMSPPPPPPPHPHPFQILHSWAWTLLVCGSYSTHCLVLLIFIVAAVMVQMIVLNTPTSNPWFWFDAVWTSIPISVPNWFSNIFHAYPLLSIL